MLKKLQVIAGVMLVALVATFASASVVHADAKVHRLVLQISDNNKQKMNTVLNVAANVSRYYAAKGEEIEVEIVAFNLGLHMLRPDTSPVAKRMADFSMSMPNVQFMACGNTHKAMSKKAGKKLELFKFAKMVPAGVVRLMELDEAGWTVVRP